jgi:hypothetical protein
MLHSYCLCYFNHLYSSTSSSSHQARTQSHNRTRFPSSSTSIVWIFAHACHVFATLHHWCCAKWSNTEAAFILWMTVFALGQSPQTAVSTHYTSRFLCCERFPSNSAGALYWVGVVSMKSILLLTTFHSLERLSLFNGGAKCALPCQWVASKARCSIKQVPCP